ncbi:uncharacterized protein LOC143017842 [Oratosquilla oratoria]|uniref:uncharacterized protein LOC143017842 n=1 Tax=Oratosquilla oratoria TaxID=337810 RepID=UPI003F776C9F
MEDIDKGFNQGIIMCFQAFANNNKYVIPKRFLIALNNLSKDNIIITSADKGGGIVIMNKHDYNNKMLDLLNDSETYEKKPSGHAKREGEKFTTKARKILKKSDKGKKLLGLLEEAPRPAKMHGLSKVHKPEIPMHPITSGINSAPHRLAKYLAKPLTKTLDSISDTHLRNSSDLISKLKNIDFSYMKLASFDVTIVVYVTVLREAPADQDHTELL